MKHLFVASLAFTLCLPTCRVARADSADEIVARIAGLQGAWDGTLDYLDYGDDETIVSLGMNVVYRVTEQGVSFDIEFREPDGRIVTDQGRFERLSSGRIVLGEDEYELVRFEPTENDGFTAVLSARGYDGGREADIRPTVHLAGDELVVRKDVRADSAEDFLTRNEFRLRRRALDASSLEGTWRIDLRPTPDAEPYYHELAVEVTGQSVTGTFYGAAFRDFHFNVDWGAPHFAFVTEDGSGAYHTSGRLIDGRLEGTTHSIGRGFLSVWTAEKAAAGSE